MFNPDSDQLSPFEERLRSWVPASGGLDRDRMLFEAGRHEAYGPRQPGLGGRAWKLATAAAVLLAAGLGTAWHHERSQRLALESTLRRPGPPLAVPLGTTPELVTVPHEQQPLVDPLSYLGLVRRVKHIEDAADPEPHLAAPSTPRVRAAEPPVKETLRPRDWDRVISL